MSRFEQSLLYIDLRKQGVPPLEAYRQAFPEGIEVQSDEEMAKQQAKDEQKAALGQIGGLAAGAIGTKYLVDAISGEGAKTAATEGAKQLASEVVGSKLSGALSGGGGGAAGGGGGVVPAVTDVQAQFVQPGAMEAIGAYALPAAAAIYGSYRAKRLWDASEDPKSGFKAGLRPANLLAFGLGGSPVLGGVMGGIKKAFGSGKGEDQMNRDVGRKTSQELGGLDSEFNVGLADGTKFDLGRDGGASYTGTGGKEIKYGYETDWNNELTGDTVGRVNALAEVLARGDDKLRSDIASQLTNAALSNAKGDFGVASDNVRKFYESHGLGTQDSASQAVQELFNQKAINEGERAAYQNAIATVFDPKRRLERSAPKPALGAGMTGGTQIVPRPEVLESAAQEAIKKKTDGSALVRALLKR